MKKSISIIIFLILLSLIRIDVFAVDIYDAESDNDNESMVENLNDNVFESGEFDSYRMPDLSMEAQQELMLLNSPETKYTHKNTVFLDTYAAYYFLQLKNNIPDNFRGSCSYVATTMLLSYYDTYWNGNVIDDKYEKKASIQSNLYATPSPSTISISDNDIEKAVKLKYPNNNTYTDEEYYTVLKDYSEMDLQRKLIKISVENHIDGVFEYFSLFPHEVKSLLEYYLYTEKGFSSSEVSVELALPGITNIREYAIEKVKQGIPVFVSAAESLTSAHSFIIYDYDEENDELYCHMGWDKQKNSDGQYITTHVAFSTVPYQVFEGAVSISFNSEHSHSNNYKDSYGNTYCSCYFPVHPEHVHSYAQYNSVSHQYTCGCVANTQYANHRFDAYQQISDTNHIGICVDCGYTSTSTHNFEYGIYSDTHHKYYCTDCGYIESTERHILKMTGAIDQYKPCSLCGAMVYTGGGNIYPVSPTKKDDLEEEIE